ncbi:MAG TPA: MFS transporter [Gaiellaceae bacterium]|nr:MFS transporter [Gaiellaceae bacterium]
MSRLGPLREREFRLLFAGRTISMIGSAMAPVALAFAVLDVTGSKADLGLVLAARQIAVIVLLLFGGVWADRLPRHLVMVWSNLLSGGSQAAVAALLLTHHASIGALAAFAAVNGASSAFFFPASSGIIPQTVPEPLLQQANATLRLALTSINIGGAAIGGVIVATAGPGYAIAVDAGSYAAAALALAAMRVRAPDRTGATSVLHELGHGWRDFWSRPWLWAIVIQFGFVNAAYTGAVLVVGPAVAKAHFGGAGAWAAFMVATEIGSIASGAVLLRWRPRRLLRTATLAVFALALPLVAFARPEALPVVVAAGFLAGAGSEIFGVLWDTTYQQEIPNELLSRLTAYDALGSWVLMPIGFAVAGPVSTAAGDSATFLGCAVLVVGATALTFLSRDVRNLERAQPSR